MDPTFRLSILIPLTLTAIVFASNLRAADPPVFRSRITRILRNTYNAWGLDTTALSYEKHKDVWVEKVRVPKGKSLVAYALELWRLLNASNQKEIDLLERERQGHKQVVITFRDRRNSHRKIIMSYGRISDQFRVSFILEGIESADTGLVKDFLNLSPDFAFVVESDFVGQACRLLKGRGELVVRLPMEDPTRPQNNNSSPQVIMLQSRTAAIKKIMEVLKNSPCPVKGVSHPRHSIVLTDQRVMNIVLDDLPKRKTYFFEYDPLRTSVVRRLTKQKKIPYLFCRSQINAKEPQGDLAQIRRLMVVADKIGTAVAFVSMTRQSLTLLVKAKTELRSHGIRLCVPSELVSLNEKEKVP